MANVVRVENFDTGIDAVELADIAVLTMMPDGSIYSPFLYTLDPELSCGDWATFMRNKVPRDLPFNSVKGIVIDTYFKTIPAFVCRMDDNNKISKHALRTIANIVTRTQPVPDTPFIRELLARLPQEYPSEYGGGIYFDNPVYAQDEYIKIFDAYAGDIYIDLIPF